MRSNGELISIPVIHQLCKGGGRRGGGGGGAAAAKAQNLPGPFQRQLDAAKAKVAAGGGTPRQQAAAKGQLTKIQNRLKKMGYEV